MDLYQSARPDPIGNDGTRSVSDGGSFVLQSTEDAGLEWPNDSGDPWYEYLRNYPGRRPKQL